ncbi:hypothetical protein A2160_04150 [Candidatus Beckwithbacteria bacterium RBG_13_42_9]|uniref:UDP-N-acetyl-alpha-D-muramoyl-L-alanyl-L-glutamate epimerase n=1 Tax=Candidatus Beckwithbacteria bacterium RBG_13_42_9 TaxID=1797457 RepID=A0A1F5E6H3_9BACT|nr:MAG: hypothetical protein A2160_04150 [Candidatus Beckwithbacteria bacterium RBG_13_42_9]
MDYISLRAKHPELIYERFEVEKGTDRLKIFFFFTLLPDIHFAPILTIPMPQGFKSEGWLENFAFHLGLAEIPSYWKAACPPLITIKAGFLNETQIAWWQDLLFKGLGEFFYTNRIENNPEDFVKIKIDSDKKLAPFVFTPEDESIFLDGGGKDSVVALDFLTKNQFKTTPLILNPIPSALKVSQAAGLKPLIAERVIDPKLLELNNQGYLNGHTPFSSYLAFLSVFIAALYQQKQVIVANERSSNEGNVEYLGRTVNHQYSKSSEFERKFREYLPALTPSVSYFSLLRPLYELQIAKLLAKLPQYHQAFKSCNVNQKLGTWCGQCAKCLFSFACLYPFLSQDEIVGIFGNNLYKDLSLWPIALGLVGKEAQKPFDCVGTKEESLAAFYLGCQKNKREGRELPALLAKIYDEILSQEKNLPERSEQILTAWNEDNFVPEKLTILLKEEIGRE